jgi:small subunit ribosomal protein S17
MDTDVKSKKPEIMCDDKNCPIHGSVKTRGQIIKGSVVSDRMRKTVVVQRDYLRYLKKFERYEKRKSRILAHNPGCINAATGDEVTIMECRPLSKSKTFVVVEKVK